MIRRSLIVLLSVLSLSTAVVFVASFASGKDGVLWDVVDSHDSLVVFNANRGGASFLISRFSLDEYGTSAEKLEHAPQARESLKNARRAVLTTLGKRNQMTQASSNAICFEYAVPSGSVPAPPGILPNNGHVTFPLWCPLLLFAANPIFAFIRGPLRRRARRKRNQCIQCGYSLIGLTEQRCPECGTAVIKDFTSEPPVL
ncbi:MAG: hypothetical protein DHS20C16_05470 [Phycisphaerae bacterium]|nr:MAG: hypothetical protein DHS20C16_05470 [Phycisphaerae bacterium]